MSLLFHHSLSIPMTFIDCLMRMRCNLFEGCFTSTSDTFQKQSKWKILPYKKLAKVTDNFDQSHCLGKRGFATEYYGKLADGREITIQCFNEDKHHILQQFISETTILNYLPHKNIVSIYGCASHHEESMLVHEYLSNGNLAAHLKTEDENTTLPWLTRFDVAIDIANALDYLHYNGIIHRNVKSSNILLDVNFSAKLANLHLSCKLPDGVPVYAAHVTNDIIGTCGYIDPDYLTKGQLSVKNDVYSFGVVLCELLSSKLAKSWVLNEEDDLATLLRTKIEKQAVVELLDPRLDFQSNHKIKRMMTATAELALLCMQCPQELRPSMEQVLEILKGIKQGRHETNATKALKIFHHGELEEATNNFDTCLGKGGYGTVYYGKLKDGREVAIKCFHEESETEKIIEQFMKETEVLVWLQHKNLVLLYGRTSRHSNKHMLVYEYISNGTLSKHLHDSSCDKLPWHTRLNIAIETATALVYLHDSGIIHRDVKGSNILLDENFTVKVADFGFSRYLPDYATHVSTIPVGTRAYIDPDYYESGRVCDKSDVYSFGVVLFELISSNSPSLVEGTDYVTLAQFAKRKILNKELNAVVDPSFWFGVDRNMMEMITAVAELAFQCVQCPKVLRPSMKQVLETLEGISKGTWGFNQIT
ncbi:probable LRR receptor-like serine/threonine-protein kinase At4g20450 isoform X1 [Vigna radiata var. radiata]|uniref:non-specific serine/threonine protein kinase n=2 Tax=Vigna radiata var. radiata TaxID=3916 RepID=A0A1S3UZK2_VIGRR|nr:probable LRR receptor-like serine/threonine-protein kinase At4g20450 isoform X1 [Vigna radiata var. radiata]